MASRRLTRVLVVEDQSDIRHALTELLELQGYAVDTAENGRIGLERLRADGPPALILLDLSMPVMDGAQFRREQLADPHLAHIPVVVCSAILPDGVWITQLRAAAYLIKPVNIERLLSTIRTVSQSS